MGFLRSNFIHNFDNRFSKSFTFLLLISIFLNAFSIPAQAQSKDLPEIKPIVAENPLEAFRGMYKSDPVFAQILTEMAGDEDAANALEAQSVYFLERFQATTKDQFVKAVEKSIESNKQNYERLKTGSPAKSTPAKKTINKVLNGFFQFPRNESRIQPAPGFQFVNAKYQLNNFLETADEPEINTVETENGITASANETKTADLGNVSVTRSANTQQKTYFAGNKMSTETTHTEKVESMSKIDRKKSSKESIISYSATLDVCPDYQGIIRGTGTVRVYNQTTVNTGKQLGAPTSDTTVKFNVTGYVNDAAEMTHFVMDGAITEKTTGYERAEKLGLIKSANGIKDGTRGASVKIDRSTPPTRTTDQYGQTHTISPVLGNMTAKAVGLADDIEVERIGKVLGYGLGMIKTDLEILMRSSISRWQNYECVDVECTAPKTSLKPNESVEVQAVSVSKQDLSKFAAKLNGAGSADVTPENQEGKPRATYTLTAPAKDKAQIAVKSTSKRGIGLGLLEIPVNETTKKPPVKKPPVKPKECDQGWTGTVKAVRTKQTNTPGKPSGRLVRSVELINRTYSINIWVLGTRDTTGGILNNFHGNAEASILETEYRERNYASGKMSCLNSVIESPETQKTTLQTKGEAKGQVIVTIAAYGNYGAINFSSPQIDAERIHSYVYETKCKSYNDINTKTEHGNYTVPIVETNFEIEFAIDPSSPNAITGSKTVQESDGSETTYSWNLTRCGKTI